MRRTAFLLLAALAPFGCERKKPDPAPTKPPEVIVAKPTYREVTEYEECTGHTVASQTTDIRARVSGYLDKMHVKDGADVQAGDRLFDIDPRTYAAVAEQAKGMVAQADAKLKRLNQDLERVTQAGAAASRQERDQVTGDRAEAAAALEAARANLRLADTNLAFCTIAAPFAGRLGIHKIDPGNLVKADDTVLVSLVALDPMFVDFDVDERTVLKLRRLIAEGKLPSARVTDVPVGVELSDQQGFPLAGRISLADNQVDAGTGTLRVRATVPNPQKLISPGMYARVRLPASRPEQRLVVPEEALGSDQGQKYVYLLSEKDEVVFKRVTVGPQVDRQRVILDGVTATDRVIVRGLQRVKPGVKVTAKEDAPPARPNPTAEKATTSAGR